MADYEKEIPPQRLEEMLRKQAEFTDRMVAEHLKYANMLSTERLKGLSNFLIDEALEMKSELGYMYNDEEKWWKTRVNYNKLKEEFIDIFHVVLQMAIELNLNADEIFNAYMKKMDTNVKRQDYGY